jgi:predicted ester cyclase
MMILRIAKASLVIVMAVSALSAETMPAPTPVSHSPKDLVLEFIELVRSGKAPERSADFLASTVIAHQMTSEGETAVVRSPADYTEHVHDFVRMYGHFSLTVTESIAEGDRVYVRWRQEGKHLAEIDGFAATGLPLVEISSAVYRVDHCKIVEYWIQIDRTGSQAQLQRNADIIRKSDQVH